MRLFVSFAHVDEVLVAELATTLQAAGLETWWDDHLQLGDDWKAELIWQIAACDAFLYMVSHDSAESEWCRWELAQATALEKIVVPVVIRAGAPIPMGIAGLQRADVSTRSDSITMLVERLLRLRQTGVAEGPSRGPLRGLPSRFTRPLPKTYRTVAQGYLRPEAPNIYRYEWPAAARERGTESGRIIGIDFGTTTSAIAVRRGNGTILVPNDFGEATTPSAVAIAEDGTPLVGQRAFDFLIRRPERGVLEVKRLFGREIANELGGAPVLEVDGISYRPVDLAALVLSKLRMDAETFLNQEVRRVVLTTPAYFDPSQHLALMQAAELAGLEVVRVLSEPVAACLGVRMGGDPDRDQQVLVYDLGGGTFDASVVAVGEGVFEVRAVAGDTRLGGADFDREVVDYCLGEFEKSTNVDLRGDATALMRVRNEVERAKIELSSVRETTVNVPYVTFGPVGRVDLDVELTRTRYNELTHGLVARAVELTRSVLDDADLSAFQLDQVLVVGRAARAASVELALRDLFGDKTRAAPDQVVALGAAINAGVMEGTVKETLLLDTLTNTLRVQVAGGLTVPVVVRHEGVPTSRSTGLIPQSSRQSTVLIRIVAGESVWADRCLPLVEAEFPWDPSSGAIVTLDVDANSELFVEASRHGSRAERRASYGLRGLARHDRHASELGGLANDRQPLLPAYENPTRLRPLQEAALTDMARVALWLMDAATRLDLDTSTDAQTLARAKKTRDWLQAQSKQPKVGDMARWPVVSVGGRGREVLVDAIEQRLRLDLPMLRRCHSVQPMAARLVEAFRESRQ